MPYTGNHPTHPISAGHKSTTWQCVDTLLVKTPNSRFQSARNSLMPCGKSVDIDPPQESHAHPESFLQSSHLSDENNSYAPRGLSWYAGWTRFILVVEIRSRKSRLSWWFRISRLSQGTVLRNAVSGCWGGIFPFQLWRNIVSLYSWWSSRWTTAGLLKDLVPDIGISGRTW